MALRYVRREKITKGRALTYVSFGEKNSDKSFYVIWHKEPGCGFFCNLFHVLWGITLAEEMGMIPVVDMDTFHTYYNEEEAMHGTYNAWEYYYQPVSPYTLDDVYESKHVYFGNGELETYNLGNENDIHLLLQKYIHVNEDIIHWVDAFYHENFSNKRVLGVHFRGQEMKTALGHLTPPEVSQVIQAIETIMEKQLVDKIFIVSEEQAYVDAIKEKFGEMVCCTNAFRTYNKNSYKIRPYPRPNHMYLLGLEVLRDMLLLSKTEYLVAGGNNGVATGSHVSHMAQIWNNNQYKEIILIDNGINTEEKIPFTMKRLWTKLEKKFKRVTHLEGFGRAWKNRRQKAKMRKESR